MIGLLYPTKKDLKTRVGQMLDYTETSMFGAEYPTGGNGKVTGVGPSPLIRKWYATVELRDHRIVKVT